MFRCVPARVGGVDLSLPTCPPSCCPSVPARVGGVDLSTPSDSSKQDRLTSPPVWAGWI